MSTRYVLKTLLPLIAALAPAVSDAACTAVTGTVKLPALVDATVTVPAYVPDGASCGTARPNSTRFDRLAGMDSNEYSAHDVSTKGVSSGPVIVPTMIVTLSSGTCPPDSPTSTGTENSSLVYAVRENSAGTTDITAGRAGVSSAQSCT